MTFIKLLLIILIIIYIFILKNIRERWSVQIIKYIPNNNIDNNIPNYKIYDYYDCINRKYRGDRIINITDLHKITLLSFYTIGSDQYIAIPTISDISVDNNILKTIRNKFDNYDTKVYITTLSADNISLSYINDNDILSHIYDNKFLNFTQNDSSKYTEIISKFEDNENELLYYIFTDYNFNKIKNKLTKLEIMKDADTEITFSFVLNFNLNKLL